MSFANAFLDIFARYIYIYIHIYSEFIAWPWIIWKLGCWKWGHHRPQSQQQQSCRRLSQLLTNLQKKRWTPSRRPCFLYFVWYIVFFMCIDFDDITIYIYYINICVFFHVGDYQHTLVLDFLGWPQRYQQRHPKRSYLQKSRFLQRSLLSSNTDRRWCAFV